MTMIKMNNTENKQRNSDTVHVHVAFNCRQTLCQIKTDQNSVSVSVPKMTKHAVQFRSQSTNKTFDFRCN